MTGYAYVRGKNQAWDHPAHKRRFPRYARRNDIRFSDYLSDKISREINILSPAADITFWRNEAGKNDMKLVFDANDPFLLSDESSLKDKLRGTFKFLTGRQKYLELSYRDSYRKICEVADLVVVGHRAQADLLKEVAKKVVLIPDYGIESPVQVKKDFNLCEEKTVNIFWEGLGSSFLPFDLLEEIFKPILSEYNFVFHFVTDLSFFKYGDAIRKVHTQDLCRNLAPTLFKQFRFYQWSEYMMNRIAISCDIAVIPLPLDHSMNYWKPENKLIHMWRMCLPTITSPIPSYERAFAESGSTLCPADIESWRETILELASSECLRKRYGSMGHKYACQSYDDQSIDKRWRNCLVDL